MDDPSATSPRLVKIGNWSLREAVQLPPGDAPEAAEAWLEGRLAYHAELLRDASTQAEWNAVVAEILGNWIKRTYPGGATTNPALILARARLTEAVRKGFVAAPNRPRATLVALADAQLILANMEGPPRVFRNGVPVPRRNVVRTMADAARCIANVEGVNMEAARKRAARACKEAGIKLPPGKVFGRNPRALVR